MNLNIQIHTNDAAEVSREVIERLVWINMESKVSAYLKKYEGKKDAEWKIEIKINKSVKNNKFSGKLIATLDADDFVFEREDYDNLDDLINNLFKHLKESLSSQ